MLSSKVALPTPGQIQTINEYEQIYGAITLIWHDAERIYVKFESHAIVEVSLGGCPRLAGMDYGLLNAIKHNEPATLF